MISLLLFRHFVFIYCFCVVQTANTKKNHCQFLSKSRDNMMNTSNGITPDGHRRQVKRRVFYRLIFKHSVQMLLSGSKRSVDIQYYVGWGYCVIVTRVTSWQHVWYSITMYICTLTQYIESSFVCSLTPCKRNYLSPAALLLLSTSRAYIYLYIYS